MNFNDIKDEDIVEYLLSNLFIDLKNINTSWADKLPTHILEMTQDLMKELEKC